MAIPLLVKRYTAGLAAAVPDEAEYRTVYREVGEFASVLHDHSRLRDLLLRPFISSSQKEEIVAEILNRENYNDKTKRFLLLLIKHKRLSILPEVVRQLPAVWKELRGIRTLEIRSVVPLSEGQKQRLEAELVRLEQGPVSCSYSLDPSIVGGLHISKGNLVYDTSIRGELERLKEIIGERVPHGH